MGRILFLTALLFVFSAFFPASGATWYVDGSVPASGDGTSWEKALKTIQEGINASSDGDTVIVGVGTYVENIHFNGKNITLTSTDPLDSTVVANTIIDGNQSGSVVTFSGTENETCLLSAFTIRNGHAVQGGGICGGTADQPTRATITHNVITGNSTAQPESDGGPYGGGLAFCDGLIENNSIRENTALASGGGLYGCNGIIQNNTISANSAEGGGALDNCGGTIQNNIIIGNSAVGGGGLADCHGTIQYNIVSENSGQGLFACGGLILGNTISLNWAIVGGGLCYCNGMIKNNIISGNYGGEAGGGLYECNGTIRNNLIVGNRTPVPWPDGFAYGGGLYACDGLIENNTITRNSSQYGDGLSWCRGTIRNCIIWANDLHESSIPTYSCIQGWSGGGEGNISQDPRYGGGEYRLSPDSPCIDAGRNEEWMWDGVDLDGNPRIWRGKTSLTVDMGAYEFGSLHFKMLGVVRAMSGGVELTWSSRPGQVYTVWSCSDLAVGDWAEESIVASEGETTAWSDPDTTSSRKFYRIEVR